MKITNAECFILESQLRNVITELRDNKVKNLCLNISIKRNMNGISDMCNDLRKTVHDFIPERLVQLKEQDALSDEEVEEKKLLDIEYNAEIKKFLDESFDFNVFNCGVKMEALSELELTFDSSNIIDFLFGGNDK